MSAIKNGHAGRERVPGLSGPAAPSASALCFRNGEQAALAALLAVAAGIRLPGLLRGFWADELYTLRTAAMPLERILEETVSPLLFLLTKAMFFLHPARLAVRFPSPRPLEPDILPPGAAEWVFRLPFLAASLLFLLAVVLLVRRHAGLRPAVIAGLFLAVSPVHAYHSVEIRYYALVCLAGALLLAGAARFGGGRPLSGCAAISGAALFGALTHMSFLFILAATIAGLSLYTVTQTRLRAAAARRLLLLGFCLALALGVAVLSTAAGSPRHAARVAALISPEEGGPEDAAGAAPSAPRETHTLRAADYWLDFVSAQYLSCDRTGAAGCLLLLAGLGAVRAFRRHRLLLSLLLPNLLTAAPFFFLRVGHFWAPRYFLFQMVALAVFIALGADVVLAWAAGLFRADRPVLRRMAGPVLMAGAAALYAPCLAAGRTATAVSHNDWGARRVAEALAGQVQPAMDKIVYCKPYKGRFSHLLIPHYLGRLVPGWDTAGSAGRESVCTSLDDFEDLVAAFRGDPFWVVSFNGNNAEPALNDLIAARGGKRRTDLGVASIWAMGDLPQAGPGPWRSPAGEAAAEAPEEARVVEVAGPEGRHKRYSVTLSLNDAENPRTPTVFFPVRTAAVEDGGAALQFGARHVVRFRMRAKDLRPVGNPKRTFRVMLTGKGVLTDMMYAAGSADWREYTLVFTPGADVPGDITAPRIGFGNRGGAGTFEIEAFSCVVE